MFFQVTSFTKKIRKKLNGKSFLLKQITNKFDAKKIYGKRILTFLHFKQIVKNYLNFLPEVLHKDVYEQQCVNKLRKNNLRKQITHFLRIST